VVRAVFLLLLLPFSSCLVFTAIRGDPSKSSASPSLEEEDTGCPLGVSDPQGPVLLFSDIESGPSSGGENDLGPFITLYGLRFGAERGDSIVTIGGSEVGAYIVWGQTTGARGLQKIVVQPGPAAKSGKILMRVGARVSNALSYSVRPGRVLFVDSRAATSGDGSPSAPFSSLDAARAGVQAGDVVFVRGSFSTPWVLGDDAQNGTADAPIAYIGHPRERPVIESATTAIEAGAKRYYTLANFIVRGARVLSSRLTDLRVVGSSFSGSGLEPIANRMRVLGNELTSPNALFIGESVEGFELGWNELRVEGIGSIQPTGGGSYEVSIHDNLITNTDGGYLALWMFAGARSVQVFNNVISDWQVGLLFDFGPAPTFSRLIEHNTFVRVGEMGGAAATQPKVELRNNIFVGRPNYAYFNISEAAHPGFVGSGNVYSGGNNSAWVPDAQPVFADPLLKAPSSGDYSLLPGSGAIGAALSSRACADFLGVVRRSPSDSGALSFQP
jgi:hypothetical protein